ncbi:hypothetical protein Hanom_Chr02g00145941 [Helianthus anomalus]
MNLVSLIFMSFTFPRIKNQFTQIASMRISVFTSRFAFSRSVDADDHNGLVDNQPTYTAVVSPLAFPLRDPPTLHPSHVAAFLALSSFHLFR